MFSLELDKCPLHSLDQELFCYDCCGACCCYCYLEKHDGHRRTYLSRLDEEEELKLLEAYEKARKTRKQLAISHKMISKVERQSNEVTDLEMEIAQRFADIHAELQYVEKKLQEEVKLLQKDDSGLTNLSESIQSDIKTLDKLISCVDQRKTVKWNMKMLLDKLKEMNDLPTVLVSSEIPEKPKLLIDEEIRDLERYFKLEIPKSGHYNLIKVDELPQEYLESESESENNEGGISPSPSANTVICFDSSRKSSKDVLKRYAVYVTHINSLDSFYVQLKEDDDKFESLVREIQNHVHRMNSGVKKVFVKELYLAKRLGKWNRVRVMETVNFGDEERYKINFIDFGNTTVECKKDMMYISKSLTKKPPFAMHCRLDNPSSYKWAKDMHLELAKLLDVNRQLFMHIKESSNSVNTVELDICTSSGSSCSVTDLLMFGCDSLKENSLVLNNELFDNSDVFVEGSSYEVFIRFVSDPSHVYVQKTCHENSLNKLIEQLNNQYSNSECDIHVPLKNSSVVVHYKTPDFGNWHRANILEVSNDNKRVNVFLVDLGRNLNVSCRSIRKLLEIFKRTECLVVCAKLADVAPLNNDNCNEEVKKYMDQFSNRSVCMKMLISNKDPLEIVLFKLEETYDLNINATLVEEKLALSTGKLSKTIIWPHNVELDKNKKNTVLFLEDDTDDEDTDEIRGIIPNVEMIKFDDPFSFYVSFMFKQSDNEKLHEELQIHYKSEKEQPDDREWEKNEKVVVYNQTDRMYYRGVIRAVNCNKYCVDLLDKPNSLWVTSDELRMILPYFADNFPNGVFKCNMVNIKPAGDPSKWSHAALEWFEMLFERYKDLYVQKIGDDESRSSMPVSLWYSKLIQGSALEPSYRKYVSVDKKVVKSGLALWATSRMLQCDSEDQTSIDTKQSDEVPEPLRPEIEIETINIQEWLPPDDLKSKEFYAYITCIENHGCLFIREENLQQSYKEMEKNMAEYFETLENYPFKLTKNQMVTVRSQGLFYRSSVLEVLPKNKASILMIDFGSDHIVEKSDIFDKVMYPQIPMMVTKIKLYDVHCKNERWTDDEVETLIKTASEYSRIVIRSKRYEGAPFADVYDVHGECLNDKIVELCPNLYRLNQKPLNHEKVESETDSKLEKLENVENSIQNSENQMDKICLVSEKVENVENSITIEPEQINENMVDQENCIIDEEVPSKEDDVTLKKVETKQYTYAQFIDEISKMDITDVYNYKTISLYHPDGQSKQEDFNVLTENIKECVDGLESLESENIKVGQPCLSVFEEDNEWYRAKIIDVDYQECGYVSVIYVDYGNFEVVKYSSLKKLRPEWMNFPARFVDATIDIKLLEENQNRLLLKHTRELIGTSKYIKTICLNPLLIHIYKDKDGLELYYEAFLKNGLIY